MIFEKHGDNAYWFYNDAFGFNGEPDGRFFTQNNGNVVRKPAQLDYQTGNGIKYRIGFKSLNLCVALECSPPRSADESVKSTISDQNNKYMSSFTFQFPWFACTGMQSNPYYWDFIFPNQAELLLF